MVEFGAVFNFVDQFFRQHDTVQVSFAAVDCQVFAQWFRVITVVTQFAGSLYEEGDIRLIFGKIVGTTDVDQMLKQCLYIGRERWNHTGRRTPLPKGKRVFQNTIIQYFGHRNTEYQNNQNRFHGISESMFQIYFPFRDSFGTCGFNIITVQYIQHGISGITHQYGNHTDCQSQYR